MQKLHAHGHPNLDLTTSGPATPSPLSGLQILLVGINYAPEPTGIAPYTTALAQHLAQIGACVDVLTGVPHYPAWSVPEGHRALRRTSQEGDVQLTRLRHYVPRQQSAARRAAYEATFLANALSVRRPCRNGVPDLVVAVTPSLGGAVAAVRLARRAAAPLFVLVQDLVAKAATQSGISGGRSVAGIAAAMEAYTLRAASRVGVVSEAFRPAVQSYGVCAHDIDVVPNWTHITAPACDRAAARARLGWPAEPTYVVHTGNMGLKQDLDNVLDAALALQHRVDVRFVLVGDGSQRPHLQRRVSGLLNVDLLPPLDDELYPYALAAADILLVNERPSVGDMALPSKITSYLSAGRPVLAAVDSDGATARELARTNGAAKIVAPGRPVELACAVESLLADPATASRMAKAGRRYASECLTAEYALGRLDAALVRTLEPTVIQLPRQPDPDTVEHAVRAGDPTPAEVVNLLPGQRLTDEENST